MNTAADNASSTPTPSHKPSFRRRFRPAWLLATIAIVAAGLWLAFMQAFALPQWQTWWAGPAARPWHAGDKAWRYGYVDARGRWARLPALTYASEFYEGRALGRLESDSRWAYLDAQGRTLLDEVTMKDGRHIPGLSWRTASLFSEGLAVVQTDRLTIVIDTAGKEVFQLANVPPQDSESLLAMGFSEGLMPVTTRDGAGIVDRQGAWVLAPGLSTPSLICGFDHGLSAAIRLQKMGVITPTGTTVIPFEYDSLTTLTAHRFLVTQGTGGAARDGVIDEHNQWIIPLAARRLLALTGSPARLFDRQSATLLDADGQGVAHTPLIPATGAFTEGLLPMHDPGGREGPCYLDEQGRIALRPPPQITAVGNFRNGLAEVAALTPTTSGSGLMNRQGQIVIWHDLGGP